MYNYISEKYIEGHEVANAILTGESARSALSDRICDILESINDLFVEDIEIYGDCYDSSLTIKIHSHAIESMAFPGDFKEKLERFGCKKFYIILYDGDKKIGYYSFENMTKLIPA